MVCGDASPFVAWQPGIAGVGLVGMPTRADADFGTLRIDNISLVHLAGSGTELVGVVQVGI